MKKNLAIWEKALLQFIHFLYKNPLAISLALKILSPLLSPSLFLYIHLELIIILSRGSLKNPYVLLSCKYFVLCCMIAINPSFSSKVCILQKVKGPKCQASQKHEQNILIFLLITLTTHHDCLVLVEVQICSQGFLKYTLILRLYLKLLLRCILCCALIKMLLFLSLVKEV